MKKKIKRIVKSIENVCYIALYFGMEILPHCQSSDMALFMSGLPRSLDLVGFHYDYRAIVSIVSSYNLGYSYCNTILSVIEHSTRQASVYYNDGLSHSVIILLALSAKRIAI